MNRREDNPATQRMEGKRDRKKSQLANVERHQEESNQRNLLIVYWRGRHKY